MYQVGNSTENGWELTDEFRRAQVVLNDSSASGQRENAELLWKYAKEQKLKGVNRETDKNGKLVFSNLKEGLYLIGQTERYSAEEGFLQWLRFWSQYRCWNKECLYMRSKSIPKVSGRKTRNSGRKHPNRTSVRNRSCNRRCGESGTVLYSGTPFHDCDPGG